MKLLRLCADQIQLNKPLPWNVRNEAAALLLGKGFLIKEQYQIDTLLDRGMFVDQDEFEAHQRSTRAAKQKVDPFALWSAILKKEGVLLRTHHDNPQFAQDIVGISGHIQGAIKHDVEAGTFEMIYSDHTSYAVAHSLQTAFVASLVAERFGWSDTDRATLINAALTMNIGMLELQNQLAQQSSPLTAQQKADIEAHPRHGREILEKAGVTNQDWLKAVEAHHVTPDGKGFPDDERSQNQMACMIHYTDVYLAKLSPRASRPALASNAAARELYVSGGGANNPYIAALIKEMGIFPPGSFVKLANGDTAIVLRRGESANAPEVQSLVSTDGWVFPDPLLRDTAKPEFKIVSTVPRSNVLLNLDRKRMFGYSSP
ncbi:MAG: HD domain-containing phosphohydrolase [Pseudomonadota bacterium]